VGQGVRLWLLALRALLLALRALLLALRALPPSLLRAPLPTTHALVALLALPQDL